jgi:hypothetical protein
LLTATDRARLKRWLCWLLAPLALFLPLFFLSRVMFLGNRDALFYGNVLALTSDALRGGHFFTRWFADANASMGSAVMMCYPPLAYIATALFELPLAGLHLNPDTRFILGIYASQVLCGVTAFAWLKRDFRIRTAFIGSLLCVLLPYKFVYIYMHFNLAQLWALAFLPLWMLGAEKLAAGDGARGGDTCAQWRGHVLQPSPDRRRFWRRARLLYALVRPQANRRMCLVGVGVRTYGGLTSHTRAAAAAISDLDPWGGFSVGQVRLARESEPCRCSFVQLLRDDRGAGRLGSDALPADQRQRQGGSEPVLGIDHRRRGFYEHALQRVSMGACSLSQVPAIPGRAPALRRTDGRCFSHMRMA